MRGSSAQETREEARAQWGHDPAGSVAAGSEPLGTERSFEKVERYRYREQPWMHDTFRYSSYAGARVLEVGVGLGTDHLQFARSGAIMTGVDLTPRCVDLTRLRFHQEGLNSDLRVMDAEALQFADDSFDAVYSFGVLHHVPSSEQAFREIRRVLRPGGQFVGALYSRRSYYYARMRIERLLWRQYRFESWEERLSRIEYSTSDSQPYVRLFSNGELRSALMDAGFADVRVRRRHAGFGRLTGYVPAPVERLLGRLAGWYLVHRAV